VSGSDPRPARDILADSLMSYIWADDLLAALEADGWRIMRAGLAARIAQRDLIDRIAEKRPSDPTFAFGAGYDQAIHEGVEIIAADFDAAVVSRREDPQ
jgi:hypothetical protein